MRGWDVDGLHGPGLELLIPARSRIVDVARAAPATEPRCRLPLRHRLRAIPPGHGTKLATLLISSPWSPFDAGQTRSCTAGQLHGRASTQRSQHRLSPPGSSHDSPAGILAVSGGTRHHSQPSRKQPSPSWGPTCNPHNAILFSKVSRNSSPAPTCTIAQTVIKPGPLLSHTLTQPPAKPRPSSEYCHPARVLAASRSRRLLSAGRSLFVKTLHFHQNVPEHQEREAR